MLLYTARMSTTKAIIHLDNLRYNIQVIRNIVGENVKICLPIKANAYGHGAVEIARAAVQAGVSAFAVATVEEACTVRRAGITAPMLLFVPPARESVADIITCNLEPFVFNAEFIDTLSAAATSAQKKVSVHLKIDTGLHRLGCPPDTAYALAKKIIHAPFLHLKGIASHFVSSESNDDESRALSKQQLDIFTRTVAHIKAADISPDILHMANSGGTIQYPQAHFDMVRPGLLVYGYAPSLAVAQRIDVRPVMELVTQIVDIKKISSGEGVSYNHVWKAKQDTYIATLPIGYADGLFRLFSQPLTPADNLSVRIHGKDYPIVGRICMDQCMVNLGSTLHVQRWDTVTLFGGSGQSAQDMANRAHTCSYEILCAVDSRVMRTYSS